MSVPLSICPQFGYYDVTQKTIEARYFPARSLFTRELYRQPGSELVSRVLMGWHQQTGLFIIMFIPNRIILIFARDVSIRVILNKSFSNYFA